MRQIIGYIIIGSGIAWILALIAIGIYMFRQTSSDQQIQHKSTKYVSVIILMVFDLVVFDLVATALLGWIAMSLLNIIL